MCRTQRNFGHSSYHSGSVKAEKRYSSGVNFVSFYTFSKSIDEQSNDNDGSGVAPINERFRFQVRWDFQNFMKTWTFLSPTTTVDLQNPQTFGKVRAEARTAEWGGQPIMHLTLALSF